MVTELSKLAELIEKGSVPAWLVKEIETHREKLERGESITLNGPNGEIVTITPEVQKVDHVTA
jgi:hypothetical protein